MEPLFEGLTSSEIEYLKYLKERGYYDGFEMFLNLDTSSDYRVKKLLSGEYIAFEGPGPHGGSKKVIITGKGVAAFVDFNKYKNQIEPINDEIKALNAIAESLKNQIAIAEQASKDSENESKFSKRLAILSILAAIVSVGAQLAEFIY